MGIWPNRGTVTRLNLEAKNDVKRSFLYEISGNVAEKTGLYATYFLKRLSTNYYLYCFGTIYLSQWRSFKSEIDIRIECKFVPIIKILLYLCARKRPLIISFTPLYIGESG